MKNSLRLSLGSVLCLLLTACVTESDNPLSSPDTAQADLRLVGDWCEKKDHTNTTLITMKKGPWMHSEMIPGKSGDKVDSYDFYPTVIGKNTFLNVVTAEKDDRRHSAKVYTFIRYTISENHVLQMWNISQDAAAVAVRTGKLQGYVRQDKNPTMVGTPPHPDVDVTLTDSTANLAKFIQGADVDKLFSEKMETLVRVTSTGK